jgi:hypothetical protein
MRIECDAEGFEHNWLDVADKWTRREIIALENFSIADNAEFFAMLKRKTKACHIVLDSGDVIDDPECLDYNSLLDADEIIWGWLGQSMWIAIGRRRTLGNLSARLLSAQNGRSAEIETTVTR